MKITVLAGSPKGEKSVTLQSVLWLKRRFPEHEFVVHRIAQRIKRLEVDSEAFEHVLEDVATADLVLWAFPVYYFLVHAHLKRFIELVFEKRAEGEFAGRYAAAISTSIHFYDHTAHDYVHAVSEDMGLRWIGSFSAHMTDLTVPEKRKSLETFFEQCLVQVGERAPVARSHAAVRGHDFQYEPGPLPGSLAEKAGDARVVVVTDQGPGDLNLRAMVRRFMDVFPGRAEMVNLRDVDIKASCQGCLQCGYENQCVYEGKDGFTEFYRTKVETAHILLFAGSIRDRYLSALWKTYFDRSFFENHRPVLRDRQVLMLVSGPLQQMAGLREILTSYVEVQMANLVGIVTDEVQSSSSLDAAIESLALRAVRCHGDRYRAPGTFRQVGGHKVFRDAVWGWMRVPFVADHRAYKEMGFYDFPQRDWKTRLINAAQIQLLRIPRMRERVYPNLRDLMVARQKAIVEEAVPRERAR